MVALGTASFHSQQAGLATLLILLAIGLAGLCFVRDDQ